MLYLHGSQATTGAVHLKPMLYLSMISFLHTFSLCMVVPYVAPFPILLHLTHWLYTPAWRTVPTPPLHLSFLICYVGVLSLCNFLLHTALHRALLLTIRSISPSASFLSLHAPLHHCVGDQIPMQVFLPHSPLVHTAS